MGLGLTRQTSSQRSGNSAKYTYKTAEIRKQYIYINYYVIPLIMHNNIIMITTAINFTN